MDMLYWQALLQGVIQGITEFLPISSTGHMIIVDHFIRMDENFAKLFEVVVQFGSILSVIVYFHRKLFSVTCTREVFSFAVPRVVWQKTVVAVVPALVIGVLLGATIQEYLYNVVTVAIALIIGGVILIVVDAAEHKHTHIHEIEQLSYPRALAIGAIQCLAMIPGTSRSASTIIGAMALGCSRHVAAEFSFFLAIPTMAAASAYSVLKYGSHLCTTQWIALAIGLIAAFLVAWGVIAWLMAYIKKHDFKLFGYYRIALGALLLVLVWLKVI